jgi:hypothetical protein|tara:strand:+ start:2063 stop:2251 length:189 start_codon:yes stop_codon:yes gene_type:complete
MRNPIPAPHRFAVKLLAAGFGLGAAIQLGISTASHFQPRVEIIEVHYVVKPEARGIVHQIEF